MQRVRFGMDWTVNAQMCKIMEEVKEVNTELVKQKLDKECLMEECFDVIQAVFTMLDIVEGDIEKQRRAYDKHVEKMRSRQDKVKIKSYEFF